MAIPCLIVLSQIVSKHLTLYLEHQKMQNDEEDQDLA